MKDNDLNTNGAKCNSVFIAQSLDGYIADKNGGLDWLQSIPNPDKIDMGYSNFMKSIDAIVMGRNTFETVCSFDIDWPYAHPVFVLSSSLKSIDKAYAGKVELICHAPKKVVLELNRRGYKRLYIDGGLTIQGFLKEDLIDELILTTMPLLLGGGTRLFSVLPMVVNFNLVGTEVFLNEIVQSRYKRKIESYQTF